MNPPGCTRHFGQLSSQVLRTVFGSEGPHELGATLASRGVNARSLAAHQEKDPPSRGGRVCIANVPQRRTYRHQVDGRLNPATGLGSCELRTSFGSSRLHQWRPTPSVGNPFSAPANGFRLGLMTPIGTCLRATRTGRARSESFETTMAASTRCSNTSTCR